MTERLIWAVHSTMEIDATKFHIVKTGYPPKPLAIDDSNASATLGSLGIGDGEQILISERTDGSLSGFHFSSSQSSHSPAPTSPPARSAPTVAPSTRAAAAGGVLTANEASGGAAFGSRPVVQPAAGQSAFQSRASAAPKLGGHSTVDSSYKSAQVPAAASSFPTAAGDAVDFVRIRDQGLLVVREVADDNSCLFNAIAYTVEPSMKSDVQALRQIVAQAILANPEAYPDVVLGRPRQEYCEWIKRENSWGGAIELAIFSEHFKIEIDSIDVSTNRVDRFGEGQYNQRALVMYSGIHYDAVALTPGLEIPPECDQTHFDAGAEDVIVAGIQLAAKLKAAHKYTDLARFTLRCSICQAGLKGEKDAQQHAQQTMHTTFEEYL
ncbi:ubiquitin-specific protease otu1 [Mortierella alpina]|nr:ubiquitin-specific protease otu1 [Mortierella alpina]